MISAHKFSGTFAPEKGENLGLEIYMKMKKDVNNRYKMFIVDIICDFKQIIFV